MSARWLYPNAGEDDWPSTWNARPPDEQEKRRRWNDDVRRQLAEDRRTFAGYFRPDLDLRTITGGNALREIQAFVRDFLSLAHWNLPTDNASIKRTLSNAVADGTLIPVINCEYSGLPRVAQPDPAPQYWPVTGGGGGYAYKPEVLIGSEFQALQRANGEVPEVGSFAAGGLGATLNPLPDLGAPARADDGFGLLGVVESAADTLLGGDGGGPGNGDGSTPLGDARPFALGDDNSYGDVTDMAARGVSEAEQAQCDAKYDADMLACSMAGAMYQDARTYALCKQRAFENYQSCRGYS